MTYHKQGSSSVAIHGFNQGIAQAGAAAAAGTDARWRIGHGWCRASDAKGERWAILKS